MKKTTLFFFILLFLGTTPFYSFAQTKELIDESRILSYVVAPKEQALDFYLKAPNGNNYGSIQNLKNSLEKENKQLHFAMNGGMYLKDGKLNY